MSDSKRNHHVPKFLLNRFSSGVRGRARLVWQFSKHRPPVEVSTKDAAVSEYFYGEPANGVERRFQAIEGTQAAILVRIDAGEAPATHSQTLRQFLWTLAVRTRALRQQVVSAGEQLLGHLESSAGSSEARAALVAQTDREMDQALADQLAKLPRAYRDRAFELLKNPERRNALRRVLLDQLENVDLQGFVTWCLEKGAAYQVLRKSAADGQIRGLSALLAQGGPPAGFAPDCWEVINRSPGTFVLGDGCVFGTDRDGRAASLLTIGESWRAVYLPISDSAVLIASRSDQERWLTDEGINAASVELAADVFFASRCSSREAELVPRIGSVPMMSEAEMASMALRNWTDLKDGKSSPGST